MRTLLAGRTSKAKHKGFSLIELLVVLVIVGIISAFVVPRLAGSISNMNLKTASKRIAVSLRYARSQATSKGITYAVLFDLDKDQLSIIARQIGTEGAREEEGLDDKEGVGRSKTFDLPDGIRLERALSGNDEVDAGLFEIVFFPTGGSSGGEVVLINDRGRRYDIGVDLVAGTVKVGEVAD